MDNKKASRILSPQEMLLQRVGLGLPINRKRSAPETAVKATKKECETRDEPTEFGFPFQKVEGMSLAEPLPNGAIEYLKSLGNIDLKGLNVSSTAPFKQYLAQLSKNGTAQSAEVQKLFEALLLEPQHTQPVLPFINFVHLMKKVATQNQNLASGIAFELFSQSSNTTIGPNNRSNFVNYPYLLQQIADEVVVVFPGGQIKRVNNQLCKKLATIMHIILSTYDMGEPIGHFLRCLYKVRYNMHMNEAETYCNMIHLYTSIGASLNVAKTKSEMETALKMEFNSLTTNKRRSYERFYESIYKLDMESTDPKNKTMVMIQFLMELEMVNNMTI